ncbi:hypothetical protein NEMBOFW57_010179 [Staphylotrichum longicolle]|uniref:VWFA domain-containing protein n=1 Tax=Staphylotrichum longicolle TaxID=669026 RepID=A0AAD4EQL6_9PEZI|nr:hypothetical protein NEMBOFW57_010179 [Staphylotrichum longicolle]
MSTSPSRSLFGSLKDKLSGKSRSRSPSPNPLASPAPSFSSARSNPSITSAEDKYAFLSSFDTIFLIDDSGSMYGERWKETKAALLAIAPICTDHDANGIDIYFLNTRSKPSKSDPGGWCNIRTKAQVEALFNQVTPRGVTPLGTRINQILMPYLRTYEAAVKRTGTPEDCGVKPINMIVITDGVPTDDPESIIVDAARKLDKLEAPPHQVGIQLFQVGDETEATKFLKELDDGLAEVGGVRDMVDTVTFDKRSGRDKTLSADAILKVVLGAVVKRLDRRRMSGESRRAGHLAP